MNDVIDQLEICFNVRIWAANPAVNACRLTADFTNQSLPEILELLCASLDATYTMGTRRSSLIARAVRDENLKMLNQACPVILFLP